jgi:hypothetical protein
MADFSLKRFLANSIFIAMGEVIFSGTENELIVSTVRSFLIKVNSGSSRSEKRISPSKVASEKMNKVCFLCVTVYEIYKDY